MLLLAVTLLFWTDPGAVSAIDFSQPARGVPAPAAPLTFIEEDKTGTSAKVLVRDSAGIVWQVKGGREARAEAFATRLVSALGYYADAVLFLAQGTFVNTAPSLGRAAGFIRSDGTFTWAGFERREPGTKFLADRVWKWTDAHSSEVQGLKILVMLLSNWDNKDSRNFAHGSNTGLIETPSGTRAYVTDWGQSMGAWGRWTRSNWDCEAYRRQTQEFVKGTRDQRIVFGYIGQHTAGFADDITVDDVRWLMRNLAHVTDAQIRTGLLASGATPHEEECFAASLRKRIETLRRLAALR